MKNKGKVSVIIPAYNRVDYIDQAITSVLQQTYANIELIVIDDGSTDGTYEKIKDYGDKLTLLTHQQRCNRGQSAAINLGLLRASGEYIAILDSDDYWELDKLKTQVDFFEKNPSVGLIYSNGYAVDAVGKQLYPIYNSEHTEPNDPNAVLLDCYIALPVNSLVRKNIYDRVGDFNENYRAAQDHDMLIRIAEVAELAYLPSSLWYYRRHADTISSKHQGVRWNTGVKILQEAQKRYPYQSRTIRKRRAVLYFRLGMDHKAKKRVISSLWFLLKAFFLDPIRAVKVVFGYEKRS